MDAITLKEGNLAGLLSLVMQYRLEATAAPRLL